MSWPALLLSFGSLFAMACGSGPSTPGGLDRDIELAPGQSAQASTVRVTFEGVASDSRCPVDVVCVWEGDAVVRLLLSHPEGNGTKELHTAGPRSASFQGIRIELVRLDPAPRTTQTIPPDRYRLVLRFAQVS